MEIIRGKIASAQKVVIYGPEGIGKSTFASKFPEPLFIDIEGSTKHMDVARLETPSSFTYLMAQIKYVRDNPTICKTLIIDTADWAETLCMNDICAKNHWSGIEDPDYGKGYTYLKEEFGKMLNLLEEAINKGVHVVVTAHAMMRKFEQPDELGGYDRWELKLQKKTAPLLKEWADMVLFANYKTISVKSKSGAYKAQGGQRVMYTTHHSCWDAKNRHDLPEELPFEFDAIAHIFHYHAILPKSDIQKPLDIADNAESGPMIYEVPIVHEEVIDLATKDIFEGIPKNLADLIKKEKFEEVHIRKAVAKKGYFPEDMPVKDYPTDFVDGVLIGAWPQIVKYINEMILPF